MMNVMPMFSPLKHLKGRDLLLTDFDPPTGSMISVPCIFLFLGSSMFHLDW
jgi:hypothetical protein